MEDEDATKDKILKYLQWSIGNLQSIFTKEHCQFYSSLHTNLLCYSVESIFLNGLTTGLTRTQSNSQSKDYSFWDILKSCSHRSYLKEIKLAKHISTDVGRCRAWIRIAVSCGELQNYMRLIQRHCPAVFKKYEVWAFIRDEERMSALETILQGLEKLQFSLNFNSKCLNEFTEIQISLAGLSSSGKIPMESNSDPSNTVPPYKDLNSLAMSEYDDFEFTPSDRSDVQEMFRNIHSFQSGDFVASGTMITSVASRAFGMELQTCRSLPSRIIPIESWFASSPQSLPCIPRANGGEGRKFCNSFEMHPTIPVSSIPSETVSPVTTFEMISNEQRDIPTKTSNLTSVTSPFSDASYDSGYEMTSFCYNDVYDYDIQLCQSRDTRLPKKRASDRSSGSYSSFEAFTDNGMENVCRQEASFVQNCMESSYGNQDESDVVNKFSQDEICKVESSKEFIDNEKRMQLNEEVFENQTGSTDTSENPSIVKIISTNSSFADYKKVLHNTNDLVPEKNSVGSDTGNEQMEFVTLEIVDPRVKPGDEEMLSLASIKQRVRANDGLQIDFKNSSEKSEGIDDDRDSGNGESDEWTEVENDAPYFAEPFHLDPKTVDLFNYVNGIYSEKCSQKHNSTCHGCRSVISKGSKFCNFDHFHYCDNCFGDQTAVIPARILTDWDFTEHPVAKQNYVYLNETYEVPFIDLEKHAELYANNKELAITKLLRVSLHSVAAYMFGCRSDDADRFWMTMNARQYYFSHVDFYSVKDLVNVKQEKFKVDLEEINDKYIRHIRKCEKCSMKGFICEICRKPEIIFPFELQKTFTCKKCSNTYHRECIQDCPKCLRIQTYERQCSSSKVAARALDQVVFTYPEDMRQ